MELWNSTFDRFKQVREDWAPSLSMWYYVHIRGRANAKCDFGHFERRLRQKCNFHSQKSKWSAGPAKSLNVRARPCQKLDSVLTGRGAKLDFWRGDDQKPPLRCHFRHATRIFFFASWITHSIHMLHRIHAYGQRAPGQIYPTMQKNRENVENWKSAKIAFLLGYMGTVTA